ncbi:AAA family ATPase [Sulfurimonas sp. NW7]|uniref:AAA family ATPase n=1 Tax=Sulfurimonas sp. NW7 TaxID=2922727 RepID=UPI003DA98689
MKILRLRSKNINSLKGENEIDFISFLKGNSLFAITGETGAGKTTLLDVISCALYGRTARLSKGAEVHEIVSRGTGDAMCEVEFEVNQKLYRSTWTLRRARGKANGNFQQAKMELISLPDEKIIESKTSKVPKEVEQITGLDFERFSQSMMLAQGGFDAFLKAEEKDRSKLLEKITGTRIYSEISKMVHEKTKSANEKINSLKTQLESIGCLSEDEREKLEKELEEKNNKKQEEKKKKEQLQEAYNKKQELISLQKQLETYTKENAQIQQEIEQNKDTFKKLELATKALHLKSEYEEKNRLQTSLKESEEKSKQLHIEIEELQKEKNILETKKREITQSHTQGKTEFERESKKIEQVKVLQQKLQEIVTQIESKTSDIAKNEQAITDLEAKLHILSQNKQKIANELLESEKFKNEHNTDAALTADIKDLSTLLENYEKSSQEILDIEQSIENMQKEQKEIQSNLDQQNNAFEKLKNSVDLIDKNYQEANDKLKELESQEEDFTKSRQTNKEILLKIEEHANDTKLLKIEESNLQKYQNDIKSLNKEIKTLNDTIQLKEEHLKTLKEKKENEILIQKYEEDRKRLQKGEACYLCGSTEHPYIEHSLISALSDTENKITTLEDELSQEKQKLKNLEMELTKITTLEETSNQQYQKINDKITTHNEYFKHHNITPTQESEKNIKKELEEIEKYFLELADLRTKQDELLKEKENQNKTLHEKEQYLNTLTNNASQLEINLKNKQENLQKQQNKLNEDSLKLKQYWEKYNLNFDNDSLQLGLKQLMQRKKAFEDNEKLIKELTQQSTDIDLKINTGTSAIESKKELLTQLQKELKSAKTRAQATKEEIKSVLDVEDVEIYFTTLKQKWSTIEKSYNSIINDYNINNNNLENKNMLLKDQNEEHKEIQKKNEEINKIFTQKLQEYDFKDETVLVQALLPEKELEELQSLHNKIQTKLTEIKTRKKDAHEKLTELQKSDITEKSLDTLQEDIKKHEILYNALLEEIGGVKNRLDTDTKNRKNHKEKLNELSKLHKDQAVWDKLNEFIGSADGAKFAKFAQGITLDNLVYIANKHLVSLSDRYSIVRLQKEAQQLQIAIIDRYQGDEIRPSNTLSGGESFLVSLSLALGLSELASQKISIDSLFLDEGFGTLDTETLDVALNALNMLESQGKMIGVISHVETMKERIPLQIRIQKNGGGESCIEIIS